MNAPTAAISLESVSKRYGSKTIIHDVSFTVAKGEIVGFLGPNGAGKTTTMRMIAGFTTPSSGRITVAGLRHGDAERGSGPQDRLPAGASAALRHARRVPVPALRRQGQGRAANEFKSELDRVASACRLEAVLDREIYKLSKGYRQRVGLAQALLGKPEVLLLDEPTAGLDPGQIQETREVIRSFGEQHAVLLSTHILPEVTLICRRVAIINQGRLLAIDSPGGLQRASEQTQPCDADCERTR